MDERKGLLDVRDPADLEYWEWMTEPLTPEVFKHVLCLHNAFWLYPGDPRPEQPHALLTSGLHSDGFINLGAVLKALPGFRQQLAWHLLEQLSAIELKMVAAVVGSDTSATALAEDVARLMRVFQFVMTKTEDSQGRRQVWRNYRCASFGPILEIEELVTTGLSCEAVREGIQAAYPGQKYEYMPYVYCVVDRSDPSGLQPPYGSMGFRSLFRYPIRNFKPEECPYCAVGSEAVSPKANWSRLVALEQYVRCRECGRLHHISRSCPNLFDGMV